MECVCERGRERKIDGVTNTTLAYDLSNPEIQTLRQHELGKKLDEINYNQWTFMSWGIAEAEPAYTNTLPLGYNLTWPKLTVGGWLNSYKSNGVVLQDNTNIPALDNPLL